MANATAEPLTSEQLSFLQSWARDNDCALILQGEVGFGRECIGVTYGEQYVSFTYLSLDYKNPTSNALRGEIVEKAGDRAYHKDDCLAVLETDAESQQQLYAWVKDLADKGFQVRVEDEPDLGPGTTTMSMLLTGRRARIGVLYKPVSS